MFLSNIDSVIRFMEAIGSYPNPDVSTEKKWELLEPVVDKLKEEAIETYNAVANRDGVELLDGLCDVRFMLRQLLIILDAYGFYVSEADEAVCLNNKLKYSSSFEYMAKEKARWDVEVGAGLVYVYQKDTPDGMMYCLKRVDTNTVAKPLDHPEVYLTNFVPKEFLRTLADQNTTQEKED